MPKKKLNKAVVTSLNVTAVKKKDEKLHRAFCDELTCKRKDFNQGGIAEIKAVMKCAQIDLDKWLETGTKSQKITLAD